MTNKDIVQKYIKNSKVVPYLHNQEQGTIDLDIFLLNFINHYQSVLNQLIINIDLLNKEPFNKKSLQKILENDVILDKTSNEVFNEMFSEKERIIQALTVSNYNRAKSSKLLNMSERTLYRKINKYKLMESK